MTMYHTAVISQQRTLRRNRNSTKYKPLSRGLGPLANIVLVAIMVSILGLLYLTQITKSTAYGYQVDSLKQRRSQLISQNESLQLESTRLQALERIRTSRVAKSLENVGSIDYAPSSQ